MPRPLGGQWGQFAALAGRRARTRADAVGYIATYKTFTAVVGKPQQTLLQVGQEAHPLFTDISNRDACYSKGEAF